MTRYGLSLLSCLLLVPQGFAADGDWPRFRGPNGTGISNATTVPEKWSDDDYNWKVALPGVGHGSPVVWGNRVFLTSSDSETAQRSVLCLNTADGRIVWRRDYPSKPFRQHRDNGYATATPAVDADGLVVTWTTPDEVVLLALDLEGRPIWRRDLGPFVGPHGSGSSPIIVKDLVVLANEQEDPALLAQLLGRSGPTGPPGKSFLIAVDRKTGKTRWQTERRSTLAAYSTPCLYEPEGGQPELIFSSTSHGITAIDPSSGKVRWEMADIFSDRCVGSPVVAPGLVIAGFGHGARGVRCVAVRPGLKSSDMKPTLAYDVTKAVPLVPTPVVNSGWLYLWGDDGVVTRMNVATGEVVWRERVGGAYYGSPVWVNGRLYCIAKDGNVVVLAAANRFQVLARVPLGQPSYATPAVSDGVMYLRTRSQLFSLGGIRP